MTELQQFIELAHKADYADPGNRANMVNVVRPTLQKELDSLEFAESKLQTEDDRIDWADAGMLEKWSQINGAIDAIDAQIENGAKP